MAKIIGRAAVSPEMGEFARCVSAVIADLMKKDGYTSVYQVYALIPESANIAPMTVYSAMYGRGRPNLYVLMHVARVLGVTTDYLCRRADDLLDRDPKKIKTVHEVYGDTRYAGKTHPNQKRGRSKP